MPDAIERFTSNPVEHKGQRVVTLAMVDEVHERPEGTAGRNFRENRARFLEGRHFFEVARSELATNIVGNPDIKAILLTEHGYLVLVKTFRDDLAWEVQERLVDTYFRAKELLAAAVMLSTDSVNLIARTTASAAAEAVATVLQTASHASLAPSLPSFMVPRIPQRFAGQLTKNITSLAKAKTRGSKDPSAVSSERLRIDTEIRLRLNYPRTPGASWSNFPAANFSEFMRVNEELTRSIAATLCAPAPVTTGAEQLEHPGLVTPTCPKDGLKS